jgi:hypothetical protein
MKDQSIRSAASSLYGATVLYKDLLPGDIFFFPNSNEQLVKTGRGWYEDAEGRHFRTGANTAVLTLYQHSLKGSK